MSRSEPTRMTVPWYHPLQRDQDILVISNPDNQLVLTCLWVSLTQGRSTRNHYPSFLSHHYFQVSKSKHHKFQINNRGFQLYRQLPRLANSNLNNSSNKPRSRSTTPGRIQAAYKLLQLKSVRWVSKTLSIMLPNSPDYLPKSIFPLIRMRAKT